MTVIDASVWVSYLKKDDKFREQARSIIRSLVNNQEKICIPAIAFSEVAGAIKRREQDKSTAKDRAMRAVRYMKALKLEILADFNKIEPLATEIAAHYGIKGADACYLAVAEITGSDLVTFDKEQQKAFEELSKIW